MNDAGLALEEHPDDKESFRSVRRAVHTLKGDSAACGFRELSELAHELEDVLTPELAKENAGLIAGSGADRCGHFSRNVGRISRQSAATGWRRTARIRAEAVAQAARRGATKLLNGKRKFEWTEYERLLIAESFRRGETVYQVAMHLAGEALSAGRGVRSWRKRRWSARERSWRCVRRRAREVMSGGLMEAALSSRKPADWIRKRCQVPSVVAQISVNRSRCWRRGRATCWIFWWSRKRRRFRRVLQGNPRTPASRKMRMGRESTAPRVWRMRWRKTPCAWTRAN